MSIINADPDQATQCTISLASGDAADLAGFQPATIIFPAGSYELQTLEVFISDDSQAEEQESFIFTISNVSGGDSATVGGNDSFVLTINPNDLASAVGGLIISEVMDGNRSGGQPKFIEITNTTTLDMELSGFQIWRGSNGNDPILASSIPSGTILAGAESWVIAYSSTGMLDAGFAQPDQTAGGINGNGNDVYQWRSATGEDIDAFGLVGTGTAWYENSVAERLSSVSSGRASFDPGEWQIQSLGTGFPDNGAPGTPGSHVFEPVVAMETLLPATHLLLNAYPNPFNPQTTIRYALPEPSVVAIVVYDITGQLIRNLIQTAQPAGWHELNWNGLDAADQPLSSGVYFCRLQAGDLNQTIRLVYLR
ncbi:MAG: lamin tail domain-containing protein [Candidatus Marinimicrobia bacterium]|nr:lamin tail domain-containing protein [Candidatus Neomarinimicrobiota bacterium]